MEKWEKYLEGDYDEKGNLIKKYKQRKDDENQAKEIEEQIEKMYDYYIKRADIKKYLVDGAVLRCNQTTLEPFKMSDGTEIKLEFDENVETDSEDEKKNQTERRYTELHVTDRQISDNELPHATVLDCIQGKNIYPFKCNCKLADDREEEYQNIKNDPECTKKGVCQYLMKLNDRWENLPTNGKYETVTVKDSEDEIKEKTVECITMTSVLFCKHGGLITPVNSGQVIKTEQKLMFTQNELVFCGWTNITEDEVMDFNNALEYFGVEERESACILLATMLSESNCEIILEGQRQGEDKQLKEEDWEDYKKNLKQKGMDISYNWDERGAGYIQITWRETHLKFLNAINDSFNGKNTATYIAENYPIEASVWYWTSFEKTGEGNLNAYVEKNGANDEVFLITQYFVNGFRSGIDEYLVKIKEGVTYEISNNKLKIEGKEFTLPVGWERRQDYWEKVKKLL